MARHEHGSERRDRRLIAGRYELLPRIAAGAVADVFRARDLRLDRIVALKLLRDDHVADQAAVERLRHEAEVASGLSHPDIVAVEGFGADGGAIFVVMEYVEGETLKERLRRVGRLDPDEAILVADHVLSGLAAAHGHGIVHGDVRPHNVLLGRDGSVKLTGFGLAHSPSGRPPAALADHGTMPGGAAEPGAGFVLGGVDGPPADVYGAGLLLYEMVVGRPPFAAGTLSELAHLHAYQPPQPPSELVEGVPPPLEGLILRALAKDPAARFADAAEMEGALEEVVERRSLARLGQAARSARGRPRRRLTPPLTAPARHRRFAPLPEPPDAATATAPPAAPPGPAPPAASPLSVPATPPPAFPVDAPAGPVEPPDVPVEPPATGPVPSAEPVRPPAAERTLPAWLAQPPEAPVEPPASPDAPAAAAEEAVAAPDTPTAIPAEATAAADAPILSPEPPTTVPNPGRPAAAPARAEAPTAPPLPDRGGRSGRRRFAALLLLAGLGLLLLIGALPFVSPFRAPAATPTRAATAAAAAPVPPTALAPSPTAAAAAPTQAPTTAPTAAPTEQPAVPTAAPTAPPTVAPTTPPTVVPSPVLTPTAEPTRPAPTATPASTPVRLAAAGFGQQGRTVAFGFAVENPNPGVGLEGIDYRVTAIGPGQGVLGVANGRVPVVGAGERRGVAGTLELAADAVVSAVTVDLTPGRPATTAAPAQVAAEGATWRDDGGRPRVVGVVVNSSGQPSGRLLVTALVLDPRGTIVGSGSTSLGPVPANGRANVEVPVVAARSVNEVELYVAPE